jgi:hypothetical protein
MTGRVTGLPPPGQSPWTVTYGQAGSPAATNFAAVLPRFRTGLRPRLLGRHRTASESRCTAFLSGRRKDGPHHFRYLPTERGPPGLHREPAAQVPRREPDVLGRRHPDAFSRRPRQSGEGPSGSPCSGEAAHRARAWRGSSPADRPPSGATRHGPRAGRRPGLRGPTERPGGRTSGSPVSAHRRPGPCE